MSVSKLVDICYAVPRTDWLLRIDGVPTMFYADSWGSHDYRPLIERSCPEECPCRLFCDRRCFPTICHVFRVRCYQDSIIVDIQEPKLISNLKQIINKADPFQGMELKSLLGSGEVDGRALLKYYSKLRDFVDNPDLSALYSQDDKGELLLFTEFLEDVDIWDRIGLEELADAGFLEPVLLDKLLNQRLRRGIRTLDNAFKAVDAARRYNTIPEKTTFDYEINDFAFDDAQFHPTPIFELDGTPQCPNPSPNITSEGVAPTQEMNFPPVDKLLNQLPGNYIVDGFYDKLTEEYPQLLHVVSRPPDLPLVFGEELQGTFMAENFHQPGHQPENLLYEQEHNDLNSRLLAACMSGTLGVVTSLLGQGASPNCQIKVEGKTCSPLIAAIEANMDEETQDKIVSHLVLKGADINGKGFIETTTERLKYTALFAAARAGNIYMMQRLLELGADINGLSTREMGLYRSTITPLNEAARLEMTEAFKLLLFWDTSYSSGLKKVEMTTDKDSPITSVHTLLDIMKKGSQSSLVQLIKDGVDINTLSFQGTPLSVAASNNQPHKVKLLLNQGADVHLASLYLSRSGQLNAAKMLVKTAYGSASGSRANVHTKFTQHYQRLVDMSQSSQSIQLRAFKHHCQNYHQAWYIGIRLMDRICCGKAPDGPARLPETLAFLAVARAVAESSAGDTGDISLIDKFDSDLLRWQMIFPEGADLAQYREAVLSLWGVDLSGKFFLDLDYDDTETLGRFKGIISRIIDGARGPLDLDSSPSNGLSESYARWRQRRREPSNMPISHSIPIGIPSPHGRPIEEGGLFPSATQTSHDAGAVACQPKMDREEILQATKWVSARRDKSVAVFFFDVTGVANDLIRGVIFSIVFVFIHGTFYHFLELDW